MNIKWRSIKPLTDKNLIEDYEHEAAYTFSDVFKKCVLENNGGRPSKNIFDTDKAKERVVKHLLSLNKTDKINIWNMNEWVKDDLDNKLIAFANDEFVNLICFDKADNSVVFWNHEKNETEFIAKDFEIFISKLYEYRPMTIAELKTKLHERKVPLGWYSLEGYAEEAYCIEKIAASEWIIYYGERGNKERIKTFTNEENAYAELWELILKKSERNTI